MTAGFPNGGPGASAKARLKAALKSRVDVDRLHGRALALLVMIHARFRHVVPALGAYGSFLRSATRRRTVFLEQRWLGSQNLETATRIAVFSHFDAAGKLHDFVEHYLRQLAEAGFAVVFVTNSPHLPQATIDRLVPTCALILRRANVGYDFGALKDGIAEIPALERLETLILANDSVYGPFRPVKDIVAAMGCEADVWGITDSRERLPHLQSYFLLFHPRALQSAAFARFWKRLRNVRSKEWVIARYEVGLTRAMQAAGLRCRALCPYDRAAEALIAAERSGAVSRAAGTNRAYGAHLSRVSSAVAYGIPLNSTHYFWDYLIERMGCPFLKRELLRDNPVAIPCVRYWQEVVGSTGPYDTGLIARHLAATLGERPLPDPSPADHRRAAWYA